VRACGRGDVGDGSDSDLAGRNREVRFTPGQQTSMIAGSKSVSCQEMTLMGIEPQFHVHSPVSATKITGSRSKQGPFR